MPERWSLSYLSENMKPYVIFLYANFDAIR